MFGCVAYTIVPDEKRGKLDAKGTKCLFLGYCEETGTYRLMYLQTKKIIKSRDVVFMEDKTNIRNNLEMRLSGRNEGPTTVVMD